MSGTMALDGGNVGRTAVAIADAKLALGPVEAFFRGVLCNALVCLAVWLSFAATDVAGRILAILFPVAAFVALGFEHSVANLYILPAGDLAAGRPVGIAAMLGNLVPVTLGNVVGGNCGSCWSSLYCGEETRVFAAYVLARMKKPKASSYGEFYAKRNKLSGFGNFDLRDKRQRPGRNPKTGEEIPISARRVVTFRPGQKLKQKVEAYAGGE
jgi:integration host factor alpha subunit